MHSQPWRLATALRDIVELVTVLVFVVVVPPLVEQIEAHRPPSDRAP